MMLLYFKGKFRESILARDKTDTIRRAKPWMRSAVGRLMQACVGPSRIFAMIRIVAVEPVGRVRMLFSEDAKKTGSPSTQD